MAPRIKAPADQQIAPTIVFVPLAMRNQVDALAKQNKVSRSEIGRRALTEYLATQVGRKG